MTCDEVQQHLLTCSVAELGALAPHLERCPGCSTLADQIRATDQALRAFVEDFMNQPTDPEPRAARPRWLGGLVLLAVVATVIVALSPDLGGWSHGAAPPGWDAAEASIEAFYELPTEGVDVEGLDRKEETALLQELMLSHATAMDEALAAIEEAEEAAEPYWRLQAMVAEGDLRARMSSVLTRLQEPSHLRPEQQGIYRAQMADKADAQGDLAVMAYHRALRFAEQEGLDPSVPGIEERIEELAVPTPEDRALRLAEAMLPMTRRRIERLLERLDACPTPPPDASEVRAELRATLAEVRAGRLDDHDRWLGMIGERGDHIEAHCEPR